MLLTSNYEDVIRNLSNMLNGKERKIQREW